MQKTAAVVEAQAVNAPAAAPVVKVIGQGTLLGSGLPFLLVTSGSELGRAHVVAYAYEGAFVGSRAQCDCMAAQFGKSCKHVLVAREWLAATTPKMEQAPVAADTVSHATPSAKYRQSSHPGDTALMRRSNRPFSLLK
jgi:hypothetical protein